MIELYPESRPERCTRFRYRYSDCTRCADACPHAAVALSDEGASLDPTRCQNCGLCASACRTGAWTARNLPRVEILKRAIGQERWRFACAPCGTAADTIVPCLGAIDGSMLAYLGKRRIAVELHGSGHCAACVHAPAGPAQLDANLDALRVLRSASGEDWAAATLVAGTAASANDSEAVPGRRQLFRRLLRIGVSDARGASGSDANEPVPDQVIRAARPFVTEPREILQIVAKTGRQDAFAVRAHEALPLGSLALDPGCTACEACFRVCPTGALQIRESDTAWSLAFQRDACVGCDVCVEACRAGVLHAAPSFDVRPGAPETVLLALGRQRCTRCDRAFVSAAPAATCPVCADDEVAFDAIFG